MTIHKKIEELVHTALRQTTFSPQHGILCASKRYHSIPLFKLGSKSDEELYQAVVMKLTDRVGHELFTGRVNWTRLNFVAYPLLTPVDGFCLCHAVCIYICGAPDVKRLFETALQKSLVNNSQTSSILHKRWVNELRKKKLRGSAIFHIESEWKKIISVLPISLDARNTSRTTIFDRFHVFVLANICRRAIIVVTNGSAGSSKMFPSSVFLPLLLPPEEVIKCPIYLAFGMDHFVPLVFGKKPNTDSDILIPIMDMNFVLFDVPYLYDNENSMEYLNKYLFISNIGFTTSIGIQEVLAARIPSQSLAKSLWKPGPNPSTIINECYSPLLEGGAIESCATLWNHVLEMASLLNQPETSQTPSSIYQPLGDEEDMFEDTYQFQPTNENTPSQHSANAIETNSAENLNLEDLAIDRQDNSPIRLTGCAEIGNENEENSVAQSSMDNLPEVENDTSSNFASTQEELSQVNVPTRVEDATLQNTAGPILSSVSRTDAEKKKLSDLQKALAESSRRVMTTDDASTYAKGAPSERDTDVPNIPKTTSGQRQSSAGAYSTDDIEPDNGSNNCDFASARTELPQNEMPVDETENAPRTSRPHTENSSGYTSQGNDSQTGFQQISDCEVVIKEPKRVQDPINFELEVEVGNGKGAERMSGVFKNTYGNCELMVALHSRIIPEYKRESNESINLLLKVLSPDVVILNVTLPHYVSVREATGGHGWDYAMYTMMDAEENEENFQISPFTDPRKCRTAGCMNLGSPRFNNFCERCHASLPKAAQTSHGEFSKGPHRSGPSQPAGKCKNRSCDNEHDEGCRGYCYHCYNSSGS